MTLLLLAGTREARELAEGLAARGVQAVASLAGATADPETLPLPTRRGGFGGAEGFRDYLAEAGIRAVVDATHPFADRITALTAAICQAAAIPYLRLDRPGWEEAPGEGWTWADGPADVVAGLPRGSVVFLATGRQSADAFNGLTAARVYLRQIDPPDHAFPFGDGGYVIGRPPYSLADELETFRRLAVTDLVVKDAGGRAGRTKLDAAKRLGIRVWMIRRPAPPEAPPVTTVKEALAWAMERCG